MGIYFNEAGSISAQQMDAVFTNAQFILHRRYMIFIYLFILQHIRSLAHTHHVAMPSLIYIGRTPYKLGETGACAAEAEQPFKAQL